ncbi:Na+/H+ antiporter NhaA [Tsuneonella mangrovi]|uniref:Na+/H+ antiporter NhaA n=1 Tax=Tsuneonella mangrovi TaxID=1982042 RepID=UPI001470FE58|nr:Na+/H+ antiporter NhaA [Tsuneonella mangrovi]
MTDDRPLFAAALEPVKAAAMAPVKALFVSDAREGLLLIFVAVAAIVLANSPFAHGYHALFHSVLPFTPVVKLDTLHLWINDGLMAVFFFVVGLEVKRELVEGDLADPQARRLPVLAAAAGMALPAIIFVALVRDDPGLDRGWAIPAATDIAFAMGIVGLLGDRVPQRLRLFLLTVAIVDDIGAVAIIALFYTVKVKAIWMIASVLVAAALAVLNMRKVDRLWPYVVGAVVLWLCVLNSGIHATIAGVVAALTIPMRTADDKPLLARAEHGLAPWNAYLVVPLFGFANAGVDLRGIGLDGFLAPLPLAIAAGLVLGKQAGIMGAVAGARWLGIAKLPDGTSWLQLWGIAALCGIGFTMSLFIGTMAFADTPDLFEQAKLGVLTGTLVSVLIGYFLLRVVPGPAEPESE